jgi:hypothetical protein
MDRFIKFKKLELDRNKITLQIDYVNWGKYKDSRGQEINIYRGEGFNIFGQFGKFYLDEKFYIYSDNNPYLNEDKFSICGNIENFDDDVCLHIFNTSKRALEVFNLLNSIAIKNKLLQIIDKIFGEK